MRKLFFTITITITITIFIAVFSLSPAFAGGNYGDENLGPVSECELREITGQPPCRRLTEEEKRIVREGVRALNRLIVRQLTESKTIVIVPDRSFRNNNRWRPGVARVPAGCFYPRPGVYYNLHQDIDSNGRVVVCP